MVKVTDHTRQNVTPKEKRLTYPTIRGESEYIMNQAEKEYIGNFLLSQLLEGFDQLGTWKDADKEISDYVLELLTAKADNIRVEIMYKAAWLGFYIGFSSGMKFPELLDSIIVEEKSEGVTA